MLGVKIIRDLTFALGAPGIMAIKSTINSETEWLMIARLLYVPSAVFSSNSILIFCSFPARSLMPYSFTSSSVSLLINKLVYSSFEPTITSLYSRRPVPAGILCPTITFSFNPSRVSSFPLTAASFKTLVVSWKEAAEIKDLVCREARVIPCNSGVAVAGCASRATTKAFFAF